MKRYHYNFKGRVQGVGFRFTMQQLASRLELTGWVKNNYDGSVEAEIQGDEYKIQSLIQALNNDLYIHIESVDKKEMPVDYSSKNFGVKF